MFIIKQSCVSYIMQLWLNLTRSLNTLQKMFSPGIEPGTFCVLDRCDNRYTTKTRRSMQVCKPTHIGKWRKGKVKRIEGAAICLHCKVAHTLQSPIFYTWYTDLCLLDTRPCFFVDVYLPQASSFVPHLIVCDEKTFGEKKCRLKTISLDCILMPDNYYWAYELIYL